MFLFCMIVCFNLQCLYLTACFCVLFSACIWRNKDIIYIGRKIRLSKVRSHVYRKYSTYRYHTVYCEYAITRPTSSSN